MTVISNPPLANVSVANEYGSLDESQELDWSTYKGTPLKILQEEFMRRERKKHVATGNLFFGASRPKNSSCVGGMLERSYC